MFKTILYKIKNVIWIAVGVFLLLSLASFSPSDPSFNTTTTSDIVLNWLGKPGSYVADLFLQVFGWASYVIALFCLVWGGIAAVGFGYRIGWKRKVVLPILLLLSCLLFSEMGQGGMLGFYELRLIKSLPVWITVLLWIAAGFMLLYCLTIPVKSAFLWMTVLKRFTPKINALTKIKDKLPKRAPAPVVEPVKEKKKKTVKKTPAPEPVKVTKGKGFALPPLSLLDEPKEQAKDTLTKDEMNAISRKLESVFTQFGVKGEVMRVSPGPVVTLYEFEPAPGVKASRVIGLAEDIARAMSVVSVRMSLIPGTSVIGIEIPNKNRITVFIKDLVDTPLFQNNPGGLPLILGKNIAGNPYYADLAKMPHLLVAGTTGSGKSVGINTMILSLLYRFTPDECRMIMVDPKMLELSVYNGIPHLLTPVVTEPGKAIVALKWAVREMEDRYRAMSALGAKNIDSYNTRVKDAAARGTDMTRKVQTGFNPETGEVIVETQSMDLTPMPYIVVVVDEMADLMLVAGKEVEAAIQRLAQMARAAGIHLILATQRPSVDVLTGTIKANLPTRISFQVTGKIDSRTILNEQGAEQLLGRGDMLYMPSGLKPIRLHGPYVSEGEVERVVDHLKSQGDTNYVSAVLEEESDTAPVFDNSSFGGEGDLYEQAVAVVVRDNKPSISYVQRQLRIGYNRAADLIDRMEREGVVSKASPTGRREVLIGDDK